MGSVIATVLVFGGIIFFHELGHFLLAKRAGVQVDEFSLGFGPRLTGLRRGETIYSLRALPLGGFVRMAGMYPAAPGEEPQAPAGRGFQDKTIGQRTAIVAAGPIFNFILTAFLFTFVLTALGVPREPTLEVAQVQSGRPAAEAGVRAGDRVVAIGGRSLAGWSDLQKVIGENPGRPLAFHLRRGDRDLTVRMTPMATRDGRGVVGIVPVMLVERASLVRAVPEGLAWTYKVLTLTLTGTFSAVRGEAPGEVLGPVGIAQQIGQSSQEGLSHLLVLAALLSANLGLINLFPIPALDGGRLLFIGVEAVRRRPVAPEKEGFVHMLGFVLVLLLLLWVTYRDILRLVTGRSLG